MECTRELLQTYYVNLIRTHTRQKFLLLEPPDAIAGNSSPQFAEPLEDTEIEPEVPSGFSNSSASQTTSPAFSAVSTKTRVSITSKGTQLNMRAASTGLIPGSSADLVSSPRQPPPPTLEQNIAYETHISSTQAEQTAMDQEISTHGKRSSANAFIADDDLSDEARPQVRRRIIDAGTLRPPP